MRSILHLIFLTSQYVLGQELSTWEIPSLEFPEKPDLLKVTSGEVVFGNDNGILILNANATESDEPWVVPVKDAFPDPKKPNFNAATSKRQKQNLFQVGEHVVGSFLVSEPGNEDGLKVFASISRTTGVTPLHEGFVPSEFKDIVSISADGILAVVMVGDSALVTDGTVEGTKLVDLSDAHNIFPIGTGKDFLLVVGNKDGDSFQRFRGTNLNRGPVQTGVHIDPHEIFQWNNKLVVSGQAEGYAVREWFTVSVRNSTLSSELTIEPVCKSKSRLAAEQDGTPVLNEHSNDCGAYVSTGPDFRPSGMITDVFGTPSVVYSELSSRSMMEIKYLPLLGKPDRPTVLGTVEAEQPFSYVYFGVSRNNVSPKTTSTESCFTVVEYLHGISPFKSTVYCFSHVAPVPQIRKVQEFSTTDNDVPVKLTQEIGTCGTSDLLLTENSIYYTDPWHNGVFVDNGNSTKQIAIDERVYFFPTFTHESSRLMEESGSQPEHFFIANHKLFRVRETSADLELKVRPSDNYDAVIIVFGVIGAATLLVAVVSLFRYRTRHVGHRTEFIAATSLDQSITKLDTSQTYRHARSPSL